MLAALLTVRGWGRGLGRWLVVVIAIQIAWAASHAVSTVSTVLPRAFDDGLEAMRPLAWSLFLLASLRGRARAGILAGAFAIAGSIALAQYAATSIETMQPMRFGAALLADVFGLLCVEQLYRNTPPSRRSAVRFLCLALAALSTFDLVVHADALLFGDVHHDWWAARGYIHASVVPLVAVSAARTPDWRLDVRVSRDAAFHVATLVGSGLFLLAVSAVGYGVPHFGGAWAGVAQALLLVGALTAVAAVLSSSGLRARLRVQLAKHFFPYRYDYRTEWLRLTDLLSRPADDDADPGQLATRALDGLAALVDCPCGALWMRTDDGFACEARRGAIGERGAVPADEPFVRFLADRDWIIELAEWRNEPRRYADLTLPDWLTSDAEAWLIVPLTLHGQLFGFVELQRPAAPPAVDWEVRDILKTAGRQIAGTLAVRRALERLVQARQFESFSRMSAFVVHDLKNLVAQLSLLLGNATRHRDDPRFQQDMLETVENVLDRMQRLLLQLRAGARPIESAAPIPLADTLRSALSAKKGLRLEPMLRIDEALTTAEVVAHRDRLERVIGHLVQNAVEATPAGGTVRIAARREGEQAVIDVVDAGAGMSRAFVETRLFRPFVSTKAHGMGIGAFESREYLREIGGSLAVASTEGRGTTFTIRLPIRQGRRLETEAI